MPPRLTVDSINNIISNDNYKCTSYDIKTKKFSYICPKGHTGTMRMDHWSRGVRCASCAGNKKLTIQAVSLHFTKEGYELLTKEYHNSSTLLHVKCPEGHTYKVSYNNWNTGYRCPVCSGRAKKSTIEVRDRFIKDGYTVLSTTYSNNKDLIKCLCPNKHTYKVSWDNYVNKNSRCPKCSEVGRSKAEQEVLDYLTSITDTTIITNTRDILSTKELDIVLPDLHMAIEYCGLYWHSEIMGKGRKYHSNKLDECINKGYKLITIFEDEWVAKNDITKSRLKSYISSGTFIKIFARQCVVKEVATKVARNFCENNHLQGYGAGASIKLGAFYQGELVALMTFSKPSLAKGYKSGKEGVWELHRFCSTLGTQIVGGASKLLTYFERNYFYTEIFSFADRRWSTGALYEKLGFNFLHFTQPNYWYFKNNTKRIHRFNLRKKSHEPVEISEGKLRLNEGFNKIWDCGNIKYVKRIN